MKKGDVPAQDREVLKAIQGLLSENKHLYGWVWLRTFCFKEPHSGKWRHAATRIEILSKAEGKPEEVRWVYEQGIVRAIALSHEAFIGVLDSLVEKGQLVLPEMPALDMEGGFSLKEYLHSKAVPFGFSWPMHYYAFREDAQVGLPGGMFVSLTYPAFTDSYTLVREQIGVDPRGQLGVSILLPNYLARIESVRIGLHRLTVRARAQGIPLEKLLGKVHVTESHGRESLHQEIIFEQEDQSLALDFMPGQVFIGLLSRENGALIDSRQVHVDSVRLYAPLADVVWEPMAEEEIETTILRGENEQVEFKFNLENGADLAVTVVSFANGRGGSILVGVDDRANVVGYTGQQIENTVRNILRHYCEPPIDPVVETVEVRGKRIVAIRVKEGLDKPYTHREKGAMIRSGSTDRAATRDELDYIYQQKQSASDLLRPGS